MSSTKILVTGLFLVGTFLVALRIVAPPPSETKSEVAVNTLSASTVSEGHGDAFVSMLTGGTGAALKLSDGSSVHLDITDIRLSLSFKSKVSVPGAISQSSSAFVILECWDFQVDTIDSGDASIERGSLNQLELERLAQVERAAITQVPIDYDLSIAGMDVDPDEPNSVHPDDGRAIWTVRPETSGRFYGVLRPERVDFANQRTGIAYNTVSLKDHLFELEVSRWTPSRLESAIIGFLGPALTLPGLIGAFRWWMKRRRDKGTNPGNESAA